MNVFRYSLPLRQAVQIGDQLLRDRHGILLEQDGEWSEASPLPGLSRETVDEVVSALRGAQPNPPSLEFALSSLSRPLSTAEVPLNALLQGTPDAMLAQATVLSESACRAIKVKVGRRKNIEEEITLVSQIRQRLRKDQTLRLDANRAWDWTTAIRFGQAMESHQIEYIEEPLQDFQRLEEFTARTGQAYALDESLTQFQTFEQFPSASALVIKPTVVGGRLSALTQLGKPITFSACYETGVGLCRIAQFAQMLAPDVPTGLDTYRYLDDDVLAQRLVVQDWKLRMHTPWRLDHNKLQEVPL